MNAAPAMPSRGVESELSTPLLLEFMRLGREAAFGGHARVLMHRLATALNVTPTAGAEGARLQVCAFARPIVHLRGFGRPDLSAMILADSDPSWVAFDSRFWSRVENPVDLPFIFACGEEEYTAACAKVGGRYAMVWHPREIVDFLDAEQPLEFLKILLRRKFGVGELHPFDHHHPVTDASFLGRKGLLQLLYDNPRTNYALVGPSTMGKTSLAKYYLQPGRNGQVGRHRRFYIDLYPIAATEWALARALRMGIDASAAAYYDIPENFPGFLEKIYSRHGDILEIIVDEVDKHCGLEVMRQLVHLAQKGVCRLVLIGRWRLMKEAVHSHNDNFTRLETIVMEALSTDEACDVLEKPLADLGLRPRAVRHELRGAVRRLGCVPGQIQEFGCLLIEELQRTEGMLTPETVRRALKRMITSQRLVGVLTDLSSPKARAAALLVALYAPRSASLDPVWLRDAYRERGISIRVSECIEICHELVIHHLLAYEEGIFHICCWEIIAEGKAERQTFEAMLMDELSLIS